MSLLLWPVQFVGFGHHCLFVGFVLIAAPIGKEAAATQCHSLGTLWAARFIRCSQPLIKRNTMCVPRFIQSPPRTIGMVSPFIVGELDVISPLKISISFMHWQSLHGGFFITAIARQPFIKASIVSSFFCFQFSKRGILIPYLFCVLEVVKIRFFCPFIMRLKDACGSNSSEEEDHKNGC